MAIEQLALGSPDSRDRAITDSVTKIRGDIAALGSQAVRPDDLGRAVIKPPPVLVGDITLDKMELILVANPLTAAMFAPVNGRDGVYHLNTGGETKIVTFKRKAADDASDDTTLLTYGNADLTTLLSAAQIKTDEHRSHQT